MHLGPRLGWLILPLVILLAACGSSPTAAPTQVISSVPPLPSSAPVASATPLVSEPVSSVVPVTPNPNLPPPSAAITFTGGVTGVAKGLQVNCNSPAASGLLITLFGATTHKGITTTITMSAGSIAVTLDSGSGSTFAAREFTGLGVNNFDAAKGAEINSPLTEVTTSSVPGTVPAITSIKGTVDCGNQVPGTSTIALSGMAAELTVSGPIDPIRVDCNPNAKPATVHAIGIVTIGSGKTEIVLQATATGFTAYLVPTVTTLQHFYTNTDPTTATISGTGAHISGTATESGTANTLKLSGDLVCGVVNP